MLDALALLKLPPTELSTLLSTAPERDLVLLRWRLGWLSEVGKRPNANQLPPPGDWLIWFPMTGRGWGKTKAGANWLGWEAAHDEPGDPNNISHVVAPTNDDHRKTTFDGPTGLMSTVPQELIADFIKSLQRIKASDVKWLLPSHGPVFQKDKIGRAHV